MGRGGNKTSVGTAKLRSSKSKITPHRKKRVPKKIEYTPYQLFMKEKLNAHFITTEADVKAASKRLRELRPTRIGIDFETASKNNYWGVKNGSIRLIQIAVEEPGIAPEQFVIDCHEVSPERILTLFNSKNVEKQIHNLDFEVEWAASQLGVAVNNIYDTKYAWRAIQTKLRNMDPEEAEKILPGYLEKYPKRHSNKLSTLVEICLGIELPKEEQSSDWSENELTVSQIVYAANDAAIMPKLVERTKEIAEALGLEDEIAEKIKAARDNQMDRTAYRDNKRLDDSTQFISAIKRAQTVEDLENIYRTGQVLSIKHGNRLKVVRAYEKRLEQLKK